MSGPSHFVIDAELHAVLQTLAVRSGNSDVAFFGKVQGDTKLCLDGLAAAVPVEYHERLLLARGYVEAYVVPEVES